MQKMEGHKTRPVPTSEPDARKDELAERVGKLEAQVAVLCRAVGVSG